MGENGEQSSPHAARLASILKQAFGGNPSHPPSIDQPDPTRAKLDAMVSRGLLREQDNPYASIPEGVFLLSPGEETLRLTTARVRELIEGFRLDESKLERLDRTHAVNANSGVPSAFTTTAVDGYVVVLDNMMHDYMYALIKLLFLATDPPDRDDPTWRIDGDFGRSYACSRLVHSLESSVRWGSAPVLPVTCLLPDRLLDVAIRLFMEPVQIFTIAHEYAHILLDHLSGSESEVSLSVGPLTAATLQTNLKVEIQADLFATSVLIHDGLALGYELPEALAQAASVAQFFFAALDRFTENYFFSPPLTHPPSQARLDACVQLLRQWPESQGDWVRLRPSIDVLPTLLAMSQRRFSHKREYTDYIALLDGSKYFIRNDAASSILPRMRHWEQLQEVWNALDLEESFRRVIVACLGQEEGETAIRDAISAEAIGVDSAPDALSQARSKVIMDIGARLLNDTARNDSLTGFRSWVRSQGPGLTFVEALDGASKMTPANVLLDCLRLTGHTTPGSSV